MGIFLIFSLAAIAVSYAADKEKTRLAIKKGVRMFFELLPRVLNTLAVISILLYLIPQDAIIKVLGSQSGVAGFLIAAVVGSVALIPAFISFPLAAMLLKGGATYGVTAVFLTTLMMVGVLTLPIEAKYFGWKMSIIRNIFGFAAALLVGLGMAFLM
ncbi:MAG: permease [Elusimicrobia bacterium HGW-Elusimicrobia-1]|jgi:uncharacterized membrane protein YraQ (UPF0718 family)|nr:MAG: permease [Elusimicrobia bacterium HGW-Elusimicrobia-1]